MIDHSSVWNIWTRLADLMLKGKSKPVPVLYCPSTTEALAMYTHGRRISDRIDRPESYGDTGEISYTSLSIEDAELYNSGLGSNNMLEQLSRRGRGGSWSLHPLFQ